jgi:hypothetical protein
VRSGWWWVVAAGLTASASGRAEERVVRPAETDAPLVNPDCGWGIWAGPRFIDSRRFTVNHNTVISGMTPRCFPTCWSIACGPTWS